MISSTLQRSDVINMVQEMGVTIRPAQHRRAKRSVSLQLVNRGYRDIHVPFARPGVAPGAGGEVARQEHVARKRMTIAQYMAYVSSISAKIEYRRAHPGADPLPGIEAELAAAFGAQDSSTAIDVQWKVHLLLARKPAPKPAPTPQPLRGGGTDEL